MNLKFHREYHYFHLPLFLGDISSTFRLSFYRNALWESIEIHCVVLLCFSIWKALWLFKLEYSNKENVEMKIWWLCIIIFITSSPVLFTMFWSNFYAPKIRNLIRIHSVLEKILRSGGKPTQTGSLTLKSFTLHFSTKSARSEGSLTIFRGILVVKSLPGASWGSPSSVKFAKRTALVKLISYLGKT